MELEVPFLVGYVSLKSKFSLEEVGKILTDNVFGSLEFGGKDIEVHDEVPAIFIKEPIMGLKIVLDGYSGFSKGCGFTLSIGPWISLQGIKRIDVRLDSYLFQLLKILLKDIADIEVYENIWKKPD